MSTELGILAGAMSVLSNSWTLAKNAAFYLPTALAPATPNENDFEPVSFLMAIAMHPLFIERGTKYKLEDHQFKPMKPGDYTVPIFSLSLQGLMRRINGSSRDNLSLIKKPLNRFCEWYIDGGDAEMAKQAKLFLRIVQIGLMSLKELYRGSNTEEATISWIEKIRAARTNQVPPVKPTLFGQRVKEMLDMNSLISINKLFQDALKKQGILLPEDNDGSYTIKADPDSRRIDECNCQHELNMLDQTIQKRCEDFEIARKEMIEW